MISALYEVPIAANDVHTNNILEVEVANQMLNGLVGCGKSGMTWDKFYFVGIDFKPFTVTSHAELPSGILGPIIIKLEI